MRASNLRSGDSTGSNVPHNSSKPSFNQRNPLASENKWVMLILYALLTISDGIIWVSFWPILHEGKTYFGVSSLLIFTLSMMYVIVFILFAPLAGQATDKKNLRYGILMGSFLNFLGAVIKVIPAPIRMDGTVGYIFTFVGSIIGGCAHSFILILPPKLAQNWFNPQTRITCIALCVIFQNIGVSFGIILAPVFGKTRAGVGLLLLFHFIMGLLVFILELIFFISEPTTPPSRSATNSIDPHQHFCTGLSRAYSPALLQRSISSLLQTNGFSLTAVSFGLIIGAQTAIWVTLTVPLLDKSKRFLSTDDMLVFNFAGIIGALSAAAIVDGSLLTHRQMSLGSYFGFSIFLVFFCISVIFEQESAIMLCCLLTGMFTSALLPTLHDLILEITYPAPQTLASSIPLFVGQIWTLVFISINFRLELVGEYGPVAFLAGSSTLGLLAFVAAKNAECRRQEYEKSALTGQNEGSLELDGTGALNFFSLDDSDALESRTV
uniref:Major facilitator superfamily (MFS) profile domain-containing protein n=1 Tax=Norrisiella sphaerica TaxID=552664 RepID=A0A7S2QS73_9EUKA|mmetsp:Transcript_1529/g.2126  ORF Transcript_1529/g.2126 Transcript_1529/m.2126 type:complete len:493 (+) Transcript_1529:207-1685(+)